MKRKIFFIFIVFFMFLLPFLIISDHFSNTVSELSKNYILLDMESNINFLSTKITNILSNEYDVAKDMRNIKDRVKLIQKIKELSGKSFIKKLSLYDMNGNLIYSSALNEKKFLKDELFEKSKKIDMPIGVIEYLDNYPPQLNIAEKIYSFIIRATLDLGYIGEIIFSHSKRVIGHIYLIDKDGNIIFDSNYDFVFKSSKIPYNEIMTLIDGLKSKGVFNYKGVVKLQDRVYFISLSNVETTTWWIFNILDSSKAQYPLFKKWVRRVVFWGVAIIFSFSVITLLIFEKLYKR